MSAPKVDFYVLPSAEPAARERFACRLIEKAVDRGCAVFVRTADASAARELDELLWTFSDRSFLPHERVDDGEIPSGRTPVLIGTGAAMPTHCELLVNLAAELPADLEAFERIAEIVDAQPERKRLARERFRQYRERGCNLETHTL